MRCFTSQRPGLWVLIVSLFSCFFRVPFSCFCSCFFSCCLSSSFALFVDGVFFGVASCFFLFTMPCLMFCYISPIQAFQLRLNMSAKHSCKLFFFGLFTLQSAADATMLLEADESTQLTWFISDRPYWICLMDLDATCPWCPIPFRSISIHFDHFVFVCGKRCFKIFKLANWWPTSTANINGLHQDLVAATRGLTAALPPVFVAKLAARAAAHLHAAFWKDTNLKGWGGWGCWISWCQ